MPISVISTKEIKVTDDMDLISRCQQGDSEAFRELVETYKTRVYQTAYKILRNSEDAWDVSQDVFCKIYGKIASFGGNNNFSSWIYKITINLSIDYFRKKKRKKEVTFEEKIEYGDNKDIKKEIENKELVNKFYEVLLQLDQKHSQVLILRELEGLDYESIAAMLNCSIGTVMSRLHYARKKMLGNMEDILNG